MADGNDKIKIGEVVSVDDPTFNGRIKVKIPGFNDTIPVDQLPWCTFGGSSMFSGSGGGSISVPRVGSKVRVQFKKDDATSMEWYAVNRIDDDLRAELSVDYEGSQTLLYDSESDLSIMFQNLTGLRLYYKGSFIQISPENNITLHYGEGNQGVQIQLSDGKVDIQGSSQINITSGETINIEGSNIAINGSSNVKIKGDTPGECAVNGKALFKLLMILARGIDEKVPQTGGIVSNQVQSAIADVLNESIQYI